MSAALSCRSALPSCARAATWSALSRCRCARAAAGARFAAGLGDYQRQLATEFNAIDPLPEVIIVAALAGETDLIATTAPNGPQAVRALAEPLAEYWVGLLSAR
jgi:hypothetical protein